MSKGAIVIGGGIAGLSAAIALRKAAYSVTLYEQADAIEPIGAALSIWGNAMAGLDWLGCGDAVRSKATQIREIALHDISGRALFGPVDVAPSDSFLPLRSDLQEILLNELGAEHVQLGIKVGDVRQEEEAVSLWAEDGTPLGEADLLIVADGIHSRLATQLLGNAPAYAGYRGVLALSDFTLARKGMGKEVWGDNKRFGLFDAGGATYWFYMESVPEAAHGTFDHATLLERTRGFPAEIMDTVASTDADALIPVSIHARPMPRTFGRGRIVCIGDAAHAMEPNQGQGACQAIEDAWALGMLACEVAPDHILSGFDRLRFRRVARAHRDSGMIGRAIHGSAVACAIAQTGLRCVPRSLDSWQIGRRIAPPDYQVR